MHKYVCANSKVRADECAHVRASERFRVTTTGLNRSLARPREGESEDVSSRPPISTNKCCNECAATAKSEWAELKTNHVSPKGSYDRRELFYHHTEHVAYFLDLNTSAVHAYVCILILRSAPRNACMCMQTRGLAKGNPKNMSSWLIILNIKCIG